ncbi:MAG: hypothetical protein JWO33_445 [Caulobacteraceae bacterium]|nr:hypothetical protein [Caulobacteraceae bacterium]
MISFANGFTDRTALRIFCGLNIRAASVVTARRPRFDDVSLREVWKQKTESNGERTNDVAPIGGFSGFGARNRPMFRPA